MKSKDHISKDDLFDSLTRNAIDFLEKSVSEIDQFPKYSVINFCSAVELFLKARLLVEHWSLIVTKPDQAKLSKFKSGDFHSVNIRETIKRLKNILSENIGDKAEFKFEAIRNHRNKLVHFIHERYLTIPDDTTLDEVIPEQYSAWYYLHNLIYVKWKSIFGKYLVQIERLDRLMHRHREYLSAKFDALKEKIQKESLDGAQYTSCFHCHFQSAKVDDSDAPLFSSTCRVCGMCNNYLITSCPGCESDFKIEEGATGKCNKCGYKTNIDLLLSQFGPYEDPKEDHIRAYCGNCDFPSERTVIPFNGNYLCLHCLELLDEPGNCKWCNELVAGMDLSNSYYTGCVICFGHGG